MNQAELLKQIAESGYNVGYGAKKHFATAEFVDKIPGWIGFISLAIGVLALVFSTLSEKLPSAMLIILAVASLYMSFYDKAAYMKAGEKLTEHFQELRSIYSHVKSMPIDSDFSSCVVEYTRIRSAANGAGISRQIFLSDTAAHYKFFWQQQIGWIEEQIEFSFFKDKIPLTTTLTLSGILIASLCTFGYMSFYKSFC
jgi:uncharacterized membrane protein YbaN (DUF454 family)